MGSHNINHGMRDYMQVKYMGEKMLLALITNNYMGDPVKGFGHDYCDYKDEIDKRYWELTENKMKQKLTEKENYMPEKIVCEVDVIVNYGKNFFYPHNEIALQFCKLLGSKTLTQGQLKLIKTMGIEIEVHQEKIAI